MAKQKKKASAPSKAEQSADQLLSRTDQFLDKHLKEVIVGAAIIIAIVLIVLGIRHFYLIPQERNAENAVYKAEQYFGMRQWEDALKGDSIGSTGFLEVVEDYGSTTTGNLAKAYAGLCYYHLGDNNNAIDYLKKYKQKEKTMGPTITATIGDCYANLGDTEEAIKYFVKAANDANNEALSPMYLKKAAVAYESLGRYQDAINVLTQIEDKYPQSVEVRNVEKEILRNQERLNK